MENDKTIDGLFQRYLNDQCTRDEIEILLEYFGGEENEAQLRNLVRQELEANSSKHLPSREVVEYLVNTTFGNIKKVIAASEETSPAPIVPLYQRTWFRVAAAAVILFFIATAIVFILHQIRAL